jgi:nucleotide-binding universal stress UspA family protein
MENGLILAGVDGSQNSLLAAGVAARMASLIGARLGLIHVLDEPVLGYWGGLHDRMAEDVREEAEKTLADVAQRVQRVCGMTPEIFIETGLPEDAIARVAGREPGVMMVIVGHHGLDGEHHARLLNPRTGHIAAHLAGQLSVPVMCVPPDIASSHICEAIDQLRSAT